MLSLAISLRPHLLSRSLSSAFMASSPPPIKGRFCGCRCMAFLASGGAFLASGGAFASVSSALHSPLLRDAGAAAATIAGAYNLVKVFDSLAQRGLVHQKLSRKIVHVLSGLLFMLSWPIFSSSWEARYFAALAPLANSTRLLYYGLALATNESLVKSVSREGKPEELLRGPLYFVMVLMFCVLVFWRESPVGIISLSMMSGGDGFADIMGRRFGVLKLPYNQQKSWVGSISMFVSGFFISIGMLYYFSAFGYFQLDWGPTMSKVAVVSLIATIVESLPVTDVLDDNISVPVLSMLTAWVVFSS